MFLGYNLTMDKVVKSINRAIVKIGDGNKQALEKLYELTSGYLLSMAKSYLSDKSLAEDVVSEVYLKVVRSASSFDGKGNGLNWLFKITKNTSLNYNIASSKQLAYDIEKNLDIADVFDLLSDYNLLKETLATAVKELTIDERRLLYLKYWEGLTVREIASLLNKPTMTTQDALKRVLKKLKSKF